MTAVIEREQLTERDLDQAKACRELVQKGSVLAAILDGIIDDNVLVVRKDEELSPAQAAEILGVSRPYVTRLLKSGLLQSEDCLRRIVVNLLSVRFTRYASSHDYCSGV